MPGAEWTVSTVEPWRRVLRARDRGSPRIEAPAGVVVEDVTADDDVTGDEKFGRFSISVIADLPVVEVETEDDTELEVENSVEV